MQAQKQVAPEAAIEATTGELFEGGAMKTVPIAVKIEGVRQGVPRLQRAVHPPYGGELRNYELYATLPVEHQARVVWTFVLSLDLRVLYASIRAVEGRVGR